MKVKKNILPGMLDDLRLLKTDDAAQEAQQQQEPAVAGALHAHARRKPGQRIQASDQQASGDGLPRLQQHLDLQTGRLPAACICSTKSGAQHDCTTFWLALKFIVGIEWSLPELRTDACSDAE